MPEAATLELRLLGDMELRRGDERLELPPSRKTRALLAYLALTGRAHRRDRLCGLLWDVADDPRGALRWSLSRLRAIVDEPDRPRIHSGRDSVAFDATGAWIDVLALRQRAAAPGLESLGRDELERLAGGFRGELLEGLDLGDFLDFQAWCVAEREEVRKLHARVLRALVERLEREPEAALPHARALAAVDPLDETARAGLVRLLAATGRRREADQQYHAARRLLQELGRPAADELEAAWGRALRAAAATVVEPIRVALDDRPAPVPAPALVGRQRELERLEGAVAQAARAGLRVQLVTGEPGIGKSSLLGTLRERLRARGLEVLEGRAFEAEAGRPFGPWIDALRQLPASDRGLVGPDLAALLPELALEGAAPQSRDRLFAAVLELLVERQAGPAPLVLALEDVHWLDAASAELLHYVARSARQRRVLIALTARAGELADNEPVQRLLRGLRELGVLEAHELPALGRDETRALVQAVSAGVDPERVFGESGGNPLFALELARSLSERDELSGSLAALVRGRVERLPPEAGDVLRWAAVLGSTFSAERLGGLVALELDRLLAALELLERHALLRAGARGYEWSHELVRQAVYSELSQPRRRLMHLRVAERLRAAPGDDAAAELAHHAALAGESVVAARACALAGRAFLRQFANEDAWTIARRGRRHAADTAGAERARLLLELLQVELQARRPPDTAVAARELEALAEQALADGSAEHARLGFRMLSYLSWEEGALGDAERQMMRAELVSGGDERTQVEALAEAARCLVLLERELPRAEALALEARARGERAGARPAVIPSAQGMLRQHQGRYDEAAELFEQARAAARRDDDRMGEFQALEQLVLLRQEQGDWAEALRLGRELLALGAKLREGSEAPFARGLVALGGVALGESGASAALEAALEELRVADAKLRLAYTLTRAARLDIARGDLGPARVRSEEAHRAAAALGRPTELLLAGLTLVRACRLAGDDERAERLARELRNTPLANASVFAQRELSALEVPR